MEEAPKKKRRRRSRNKKELVDRAIASIEAKLDKDELKPTYGDLIRLLQMRKEEEEPTEITVSWVEPKKDDANGE
jgi:hypothetical protein